MSAAQTRVLSEGIVSFGGDAQLLAELGERLIAKPTVAVAELVKNAYDADATAVNVWISKGPDSALHLLDDGHGMTEDDFKKHWMRIGTTKKLPDARSPRFRRRLTGSKGVGRFAARRLGRSLKVVTVALEPITKQVARLEANFDWDEFEAGRNLEEIQIRYRVVESPDEKPGTHLEIGKLSDKWDSDTLMEVTDEVLDIVNPAAPTWLTVGRGGSAKDPGLSLYFGQPATGRKLVQASDEIVDRWLARVTTELSEGTVRYSCEYRDVASREVIARRSWNVPFLSKRNLVGTLRAEIRYFPRREGVFSGMSTVDGRKSAQFLRDKGGVRVIDRGVRLPPYGDPDDDWLYLTGRVARNLREWMSPYTKRLFPESDLPTEGRYSPFLRTPAAHQLLGWVSVETFHAETARLKGEEAELLQSAMDRQGLVPNAGFDQLKDIITGGVELLSIVDTQQIQEEDRVRAKAEVKELKEGLSQAARRVQASTTIASRDKTELLRTFKAISEQASRTEEARVQALEAVESVSLLGVLAGFMTHETTIMFRSVETALEQIESAEGKPNAASLREAGAALREAQSRVKSFIDYAQMFLRGLPEAKPTRFDPREQIDMVVDLFSAIAKDRAVRVENRVPKGTPPPAVWVGLYSGVVMNLLTNSLKALFFMREGHQRLVRIEAALSSEGHVLKVSDTGIGVPPEVRDYLFQPFFTTTRDQAGPLGGGLGLGLYIVRRALRSVGGRIRLAAPMEGFTTTFEVLFPAAR